MTHVRPNEGRTWGTRHNHRGTEKKPKESSRGFTRMNGDSFNASPGARWAGGGTAQELFVSLCALRPAACAQASGRVEVIFCFRWN